MAFDGSIKIDTAIDGNGFQAGVGKLGDMAKGALSGVAQTTAKIVTASVAALATAAVAIGKEAIAAYAEYEQLVGGVDTLFKDSSKTVQDYAANAYKTAGLSANEYMATVTSFSASLLQSLGGNTAEAANVADMALTDMADNANKMGSSMESIQNAYQGFAKQNYTMLDNLKLGYGGTKTEMERLLSDAQKFSGVKYDINNLNDVYQAIHVIQGELGITGTTALEASTTIQGSAASMQAAWANMLVGIADENQNFDVLLTNLIESVGTFAENLLPRVETALSGVTKLFEKLIPKVAETLPGLIADLLPKLAAIGVSAIQSLAQGIQDNSAALSSAAVDIVTTLIRGIITVGPDILATGGKLLLDFAQGFAKEAPALADEAGNAIVELVNGLAEGLPSLIDSAITIAVTLVTGIADKLPELIPGIVQALVDGLIALLNNAPAILDAGVSIITGIQKGVMNALPGLIAALPEILIGLVNLIFELFIAQFEIAFAGLSALWEMIGPVLQEAFQPVIDFFTVTIPEAWNALVGIFQGIPEWWSGIWDQIGQFFTDCWDGIVSFFTDTLPGIIQSAIDWFNDLPYNIGLALGNAIAAILQFGVDAWNWVTTEVPKIITGIIDWFAKLPGRIWTWLTDVISKIGSWGSDMFNKAKSAASNTITAVVDFFSQMPGKIWTWLTNAVTKVGQWGKDMLAKAKTGVSDTVNGVVNGFKNLPSKIYEVGSNLVKGLWNGIQSVKDWILGKISGFVGGIMDGIKGFFGIHSPSTLMRDEVGKFLPPGITVGMDKAMPAALRDIEGQIDAMMGKAQTTVEAGQSKIGTVFAAKMSPITFSGDFRGGAEETTPAANIIAETHVHFNEKEVAVAITPAIMKQAGWNPA